MSRRVRGRMAFGTGGHWTDNWVSEIREGFLEAVWPFQLG